MTKVSALSFLALAALSTQAQAASELTCWDIFAKRGSAPILTADIAEGEVLGNVTFDLKNPVFEHYFFDNTEGAIKSSCFIQNPAMPLEPREITTNRSPYKGNNEYPFEFGQYTYEMQGAQKTRSLDARLILPKDLSPEALENFRIRKADERSNAVMIYRASPYTHQAGDNYLRMFCVSH